MKRKTALVAGALGIVGRSLVSHLATLDDWNVIALSRRAPEFRSSAQWISVDLLDRSDCEQKLHPLDAVTHVFFAAYAEQATEKAQVDVNRAMLANLTETIDAIADVQRIVLVEGAKCYGAQLGPYKTPAKETDPRVLPPNFYYDQEDSCAPSRNFEPTASFRERCEPIAIPDSTRAPEDERCFRANGRSPTVRGKRQNPDGGDTRSAVLLATSPTSGHQMTPRRFACAFPAPKISRSRRSASLARALCQTRPVAPRPS
jgi:hypothetical protein